MLPEERGDWLRSSKVTCYVSRDYSALQQFADMTTEAIATRKHGAECYRLDHDADAGVWVAVRYTLP
jgi:hypothetical protein